LIAAAASVLDYRFAFSLRAQLRSLVKAALPQLFKRGQKKYFGAVF
jgi:hypothetical protein